MAETLLSPSVLEVIPDAVAAVNRQGVIILVNSQTEGLFSYTRDELIGQKIEILAPERQRPEHDRHREQFHAKPKIRRMGSGLDRYGRRRDGSEFPVEISLSPIVTADGTIVLSVIRDISDRKRMAEDLRRANEDSIAERAGNCPIPRTRLGLIVDSSQDAIIGKNLDGIITQRNKGAEHMYGYSAPEMIGRPTTLCLKDRVDEISVILDRIRRGERVEYFESVRVTKDGQWCHTGPSLPQSWLMLRADVPFIARRISGRAKVQPSASRRAVNRRCT